MAQVRDLEGSQDHPMVSRYPGAVIKGYSRAEYNEVVFPTGPYDSKARQYRSTIKVEGQWTRILYLYPEDISTLAVFRNYEKELRAKGGKFLFTCVEEKCQPHHYKGIFDSFIKNLFWTTKRRPKGNPTDFLEFLFNEPVDLRYLLAQVSHPEKGEIYVSLLLAKEASGIPSGIRWATSRVLGFLEIVEVEPLETGKVKITLTPETISRNIKTSGHVKIYGIYFDFGKAEIKPESRSTLDAIARYLRDNPDVKLYVVGHTDSVGEFDYNMELSRRRAESVVRYLVEKYGIKANRLKPYGIGPLAPVASNDTEQGRARNRRVELVKQ